MAIKKTPSKSTPASKKFSNVASTISGRQTPGSAPAGKAASYEDIALMTKRRQDEDIRLQRESEEKQKSATPGTDKVRKFLALAMQRFKLSAEATEVSRKARLDDLKFSIGEQWDAQTKSNRELDKRPCLTINRFPQFVRIVTNEMRQLRQAIIVNPVGDGADVQTAQILQGAVRHIEVNSDAEVAYDIGGDFLVRTGLGYWRLITEYIKGTFDQQIKIKAVRNPFAIYEDPNCIEPDHSDSNWCFVVEDIPRDLFTIQNPNAAVTSLTDFTSIGDKPAGWVTKESIRIAEYFYVDMERVVLCHLPDGSVVTEDKVPEGIEPEEKRTELKRTVKWAKISAVDCLEGGPEDEVIWPGQFVPIIPVIGDDIIVDGKLDIAGMIRAAKDPARMYNFWISAATEAIALAPKAPFVAADGQIEDHEEEWRNANVRNFAVLRYKPVTVEGQVVGPPQRNTAETPIQAMGAMIRQADADLKSTMGLPDASLGQRAPDESGKAALIRKKQGDTATYNYTDNQARAIRCTGRQLVDLIPKVITAPRLQRIIKPDQAAETVGMYNSQYTDQTKEQIFEQLAKQNPDLQNVYDVGVGMYDVAVAVGPSNQTKRQEAVEAMMAIVEGYPQLMQIAGDLVVQNMDWPGAQEIATRLKKMLPPQLQDVDSQDPQIRLIAVQSQLQALMQQHDAVTQELNAATEMIRSKTIETESKERIAMIQAQVQLLSAEAGVQGEMALTALNAEIAHIQAQLGVLNEGKPIGGSAGAVGAPPGPIPSAPPPVASAPGPAQ
jgi:portal protein